MISTMNTSTLFASFVLIFLVVLALSFKPLRKAIGLLLVILGVLVSLTVVGLVVGIPMILIGGVLLFI
jgi:hypothetical protein